MALKKTSVTLLLLILLPCLHASADQLDSLLLKHDTVSIYRYVGTTDSLALKSLRLVKRAVIDGFQKYTFLDKQSRFYAGLGNTGLAYKSLLYQPAYQDGFYLGINSFDSYTYRDQNTSYYVHRKPVTYLYYANGSKKEQLFRVVHSNKIANLITIGVDFYLVNSPGNYIRQKSDDKSVAVTAQYYTKDLRYGVIANYTHNKFIVFENGGIANDSVFEDNIESDRRLINVNLLTAQNLVKEAGIGMNQYFYLSKAPPAADSSGKKKSLFHAGRLAYTFNYSRQIQVYTDQEPRSAFYAPYDTILDTLKTDDSLHVETYENILSWSNLRLNDNPDQKIFYLNLFLKNQYSEMSGYEPKRIFMLWIPGADAIIRPFKGSRIDFNGSWSTGEFNDKGYMLDASIAQQFKKGEKDYGTLSLGLTRFTQDPGWIYQHYQSNHFRWDNNFLKQQFSRAGFSYTYKRLRTGIDYWQVRNLTYLDTLARPHQFLGNTNIMAIYLYKDFKIGIWNLDNALIYQKASGNDVVRLPEFMANIAFYVTLPLFKNAAVLQPGLEFFYNTAYYADSYMPATRSFYLQDSKEIGNYIYADVYVNVMIKTFRFFLKYNHFNSSFSGRRYYMAPHYPLQDAAFKFGVSWNFYD
jgi:hypothetical protein